MEDIEQPFIDNLNRLTGPNGPTDPIAWNMNKGLLLMAQRLGSLQREMAQIREWLETAPPHG